MHGNEINGIQLVQQFIHSLEINKLKGTIIIIPVLNVTGFKAERRKVQYDDKDLNRSFPGRAKGSPTSRIAYYVMKEVISKCDFGIDCHDSGSENILLPHSRIHVSKSGACEEGCTLDMGSIFGTELIMKRRGKPGMMAMAANKKHSTPVLTVEIGGGMKLWPGFLQEGVRGIKNTLIHNNMLPGQIILPRRQFVLDYRENYKAPSEGILRLRVNLGDAVEKGSILAEIHNPLEESYKYIKAREHGIVLSIKHQAKVVRHEGIVSLLNLDLPDIKLKKLKDVKQIIVNKPKKGFIKLRKSILFHKALKLKK